MKCHKCQDNVKKVYKELNFYACRNCGLYARYPMPTVSELNHIYSKCYHIDNIEKSSTNQISPNILNEKFSKFITESIIKKYLGHNKRIKYLDYGAGTGNLLDEVRKSKSLSLSISGFEFSKEAIQYCNELLGDGVVVDNLSYLSAGYNIISMIEVVEHLRQPWNDLSSIYNILDHNGILFITTPNLNGLNSLLTRSKWREQNKDFHLVMFKKRVLKNFLIEAGFKDISFIKYTPLPPNNLLKTAILRCLQFVGLYGGIAVIAHK